MLWCSVKLLSAVPPVGSLSIVAMCGRPWESTFGNLLLLTLTTVCRWPEPSTPLSPGLNFSLLPVLVIKCFRV